MTEIIILICSVFFIFYFLDVRDYDETIKYYRDKKRKRVSNLINLIDKKIKEDNEKKR